MRRILCIGAALTVAVGLWSCGSDEGTTKSAAPSGPFAVITGETGQAEPIIHPSDNPPPKKSLVKDIEVGKGPVARKGDMVAVHYIGVQYSTGEKKYSNWSPEQPFETTLRQASAWEEGIEGMRAGGRREILLPARLAFGDGAMDYLVDLVAIRPTR
jgi:peptidylprolyl isomerase